MHASGLRANVPVTHMSLQVGMECMYVCMHVCIALSLCTHLKSMASKQMSVPASSGISEEQRNAPGMYIDLVKEMPLATYMYPGEDSLITSRIRGDIDITIYISIYGDTYTHVCTHIPPCIRFGEKRVDTAGQFLLHQRKSNPGSSLRHETS